MPTDPEDPSTRGESAHEAIQYTVDAIAEAGFYVDTDLWPTAHSVACSQCHQGYTGSSAP